MIIKKKRSYKNIYSITLIIFVTFLIGNYFSNEITITGFTINQNIGKEYLVFNYDFESNTINQSLLTNESLQGKALLLNGVTDYVDTEKLFNYSNYDQFSEFLWFKPNFLESGISQHFTSELQEDSFEFTFRIEAQTEEPYINLMFGKDGDWFLCHTNLMHLGIITGEWYHTGFTINDIEKEIKLYLNGENIKTCEYEGNIKPSTGSSLKIGSNARATNHFFNGTIDELRIFNKTLNRNEIMSLYTGLSYQKLPNLNEDTVILEIRKKEFQQLSEKREEALKIGALFSSSEDYVPINLTHNGKIIKAKARLKGDYLDHLKGDQWSFRVEILDKNTFFGMKTFSLQTPERRGGNYEWIFHKLLAEEDLPSLRYIFINLTLNNKGLGTYVIEEHFDKLLIENNNRVEGPIIKINEDLGWYHCVQNIDRSMCSSRVFIEDFDAFKLNSILKDYDKYNDFLIGRQLLESLREGKLKANQVFDIDKLSKFMAILDLTGSWHAFVFNNMRFYYNPITSLLEPIGYDAHSGFATTTLTYHLRNTGYPTMFLINDIELIERYISELERVSKKEYLDNFLNKIPEEISFSEKVLYNNQEFIKNMLNPIGSIQAYAHNFSNGLLTLDIGNIQKLPIQILSLNYDGVEISKNENVSEVLMDYELENLVEYKKFYFRMPKGFEYNNQNVRKLTVNFKTLGTNTIRNETVHPYLRLDEDFFEENTIRQEQNIDEFNFLIINHNNKTITIKQGEHEINKTLIIPENYTVYCTEDTLINFKDSGKIISYSKLIFQGTNEHPIRITSFDGTGQGIVLLNVKNESIIDNVIFSNLKSPNSSGWSLTGTVTFYESPITIKNTAFLDSESEDSLNIVRTSFNITNTLFQNAISDCFDADFTIGNIVNLTFINCNGDAVDFSGSTININNLIIQNASDKGVSIGEKTNATINNVNISKSFIGISSKDYSNVNTSFSIINDSVYGFAIYNKKTEYGPASVIANNSQMNQNENNYLVEEGSSLTINGEVINNKTKSVYALLYDNQ